MNQFSEKEIENLQIIIMCVITLISVIFLLASMNLSTEILYTIFYISVITLVFIIFIFELMDEIKIRKGRKNNVCL